MADTYLTRVIDETSHVARHSGINNIITVNTKHVAANSLEEEQVCVMYV